MALGGGTFTSQNKILPGSYINFVSLSHVSVDMSERGYVAMMMPSNINFGEEGKIIKLNKDTFSRKAMELFGYEFDAPELTKIRDTLKQAKVIYLYREKASGAVAANNDIATCKFKGARGNKIAITVKDLKNGTFEVTTLIDGKDIDSQVVAKAGDLKDNSLVTFTASNLKAVVTKPLTSGADGTSNIQTAYQEFLKMVSPYAFNVLVAEGEEVTNLAVEYAKKMREEVGKKFQVVCSTSAKPNYEGVVNVKQSKALYWVAGALAGCDIAKSLLNKPYEGEEALDDTFTQEELEDFIRGGVFALHQVGNEYRVLADINSLTTFTKDKNEDFAFNQTIRVLDQIATDIAVIFNTKYVGNINNDKAGRISLWADLIKYFNGLEALGAIVEFDDREVEVLPGEKKDAVVVNSGVLVNSAMAKLYMTVNVR